MACQAQDDEVFNSGVILVKDKELAANRLESTSCMAMGQKLAYGDQTALNQLCKNEIAAIPEEFFLPRELPFWGTRPNLVFYHAWGLLSGAVPQLGGEADDKFFYEKANHLFQMKVMGETVLAS